MTLSMTAFARSDMDTPSGALVWELRSVNHRYLELSLKLPEELRALEPQVREAVARRIARGKVDCSLRLKPREGEGELRLDADLVKRLAALGAEVQALAPNAGALRAIDFLRWPGTLAGPAFAGEALQGPALDGLTRAIDELVATRAREGERLQALIEQRLAGMDEVLARIKLILPEIVPQFRERLKERLAEIRQQVDSDRLEQEMVIFAQRIDVQEEVDRLATHLGETRRVLEQGGAVGRRLDFLMQEFNREANTIASKSPDIRLTNAAVELKVLIEQMREQVQNIE